MRAGLRRPTVGHDDGVSLIEVVVAALLLMILASTVLRIVIQTQSAEVDNRARVAASSLASREISMVTEEFYTSSDAPADIAAAGVVTNPHPLDGGMPGDPLVLEGTSYTVTRSAAWNITGKGGSACDGGLAVQYPVLVVTVSVTWADMGVTAPVVSSTVLSPDKVAGVSATDAFVAVKVVDSKGADNPGRRVWVQAGGVTLPGLTDTDGCAVVQVSPGITGTDYTVTLGDPGYVDLSGNNAPSKLTGTVHQGDLNTSASFAYDLGGTVSIQLVDGDGNPMSGPLGSSTQVTLVASEYSGATGATSQTVSDGLTTLSDLFWPTTYGAYLGTTPPADYDNAPLEPGGHITVDVRMAKATVLVTGAPSGAQVVAVPAGTGDCTVAGAVGPFAQDASTQLLPGSWDFFVIRDGADAFACSPGPAGVALAPNEDREITWEVPAVTVPAAPTSGTLYALDRGQVSTPLTTCPTGPETSKAWSIDAARTGAVPLPAGDWYFYVVAGDGTCEWDSGIAPYTIPYDSATHTVPWSVAVSVTVTGIESIYSSTMPQVYLTQSSALSCSRYGITSTDGSTVVNLGTPAPGASLSATVPPGTWYVYGNDPRSPAWYTWNPTCRKAGTLHVASSPLSIDYNTSSPQVVP